MLPDLEYLIRLQQLHDAVERDKREIDSYPQRSAALDERLSGARERVASAKQRVADNQAARRAIEKDLAALNGRLSKYKDQLMEVKTNREYAAMQKEIETAQHEVGTFEDKMLERMVELDELNAEVKRAEAEQVEMQKAIDGERRDMEKDVAERKTDLERSTAAREDLVQHISKQALELFEYVQKRRGIAVVQAKGGHCTFCHVRLRPQVFNDIRRNDSLIQCDSCQRILYFDQQAEAAGNAPA